MTAFDTAQRPPKSGTGAFRLGGRLESATGQRSHPRSQARKRQQHNAKQHYSDYHTEYHPKLLAVAARTEETAEGDRGTCERKSWTTANVPELVEHGAFGNA